MKTKVLLSLLLLVCSTTIFATVSEIEKNALIDLYNSTEGENWNSTWNLNQPVESWYGVTVENSQVVIIRINTIC